MSFVKDSPFPLWIHLFGTNSLFGVVWGLDPSGFLFVTGEFPQDKGKSRMFSTQESSSEFLLCGFLLRGLAVLEPPVALQ